MHEFLSNIGTYVQTSPWLALVAAFAGGLLTASNPCVLAMIPLMIGFVAGRRERSVGTLRAFAYSLLFVSGLAITFTALGVITALAGRMYGDVSGAWNWIVALVCAVMGLHMLGVIDFEIPAPIKRQPKLVGALGALVLGLLFGFVSLPCAGPILVVLLTYLASSGSSVPYGGALLLTYAIGHSVLILLAGTSMGLARKFVESRRMSRITEILRRVAGVVVLAVGLYFIAKSVL